MIPQYNNNQSLNLASNYSHFNGSYFSDNRKKWGVERQKWIEGTFVMYLVVK